MTDSIERSDRCIIESLREAGRPNACSGWSEGLQIATCSYLCLIYPSRFTENMERPLRANPEMPVRDNTTLRAER